VSDGGGDGPPRPPSAPAPTAAALAALPSDASAWLLPHLRAALYDLDDVEVTPVVRRLRAAPTSRLAGGRVRRELDQLLAAGGPVWRALVTRIREAPAAPPAVAHLLDPDRVPPAPSAPAPTPAPVRAPAEATPGRADERARQRLREVRAERDELRRRLTGAIARASAAEEDAARTATELRAARERIVSLEAEVAASGDERARAVDRERRRRDAEIARLEDDLARRRRVEDERHLERRRREKRERAAREDAARRELEQRRTAAEPAPARLVPGRPSRLPADVHPGTTEEADLLLHAGRLVLVDGYNVTKQHQPDLDLEGQRAWLVRTLASLAARRRVRPTAVFDGQRAAGARPAAGSREVAVRFTPAGVTADDELVLAVEATDEPVVVVTDDRELTGRLAASGADVIGTRAFLGATR
jgi:predicted RNA-binding protein with PIN domain